MAQLTHSHASVRRTLLIGVLTMIVTGIAATSARRHLPGAKRSDRLSPGRSRDRLGHAADPCASGRHAGHRNSTDLPGFFSDWQRRRQAHRVRFLRARRRSSRSPPWQGRRQRLARDHVRPGHPRGAVMVGERPPHRVRLLAGAVRPETIRRASRPASGRCAPTAARPSRCPWTRQDSTSSPDMRRTAAGSRSRACGSREAATRRRYSSFARRVAASTSSRHGETFVEHPIWSPDSRWITFNIGPDGHDRGHPPGRQ